MSLERAVSLAARLLRDRLDCGRVLYGDLVEGVTLMVEPGSSTEGVERGAGRWELGSWWPPGARADFEQGVPLVCGDIAQEPGIPPETRSAYAAWGVAALLNAPVVERGRVVAVVVVHDELPREWTDEEIALVAETADSVWRATTGEL